MTSIYSWKDPSIVPNRIRWILFFWYWGISFLIGVALIIGLFKFQKIRKLVIIEKRFPDIIFIECICSIIFCFIECPILAQDAALLEGVEWIENNRDIIHIVAWFIFSYLNHFIINLEAWRLWLMYYKLNNLHSTINYQWKNNIDRDIENTDFFLSKNQTFGNKMWIGKRIICWYLFSSTTSNIILQLKGDNWITMFIDALLLGFPSVVMLILYIFCPKIKDQFLFYYEFKYSAFVYMTALTAYLSHNLLRFYDEYVALFFATHVGLYAFSFVSLLSVSWIPYKILNDYKWNNQNNDNKEDSVSTATKSHTAILMHTIINTNEKQQDEQQHDDQQHDQPLKNQKKKIVVKLSDILSNMALVEKFALQLVRFYTFLCVVFHCK